MAENKIKIAAIAGSLRNGSYNATLLETAKSFCPENTEINILDITDIPLFGQDKTRPESVIKIRENVEKADGVLLVTPEYNYSVPGVFKNVIDWISYPIEENSLDKKPVGIMSASIGMFGGARAQYHLRQILVSLNTYVMSKPEVMLPLASQKIKENKIIDEETNEKIKNFMSALAIWIKRFKKEQ